MDSALQVETETELGVLGVVSQTFFVLWVFLALEVSDIFALTHELMSGVCSGSMSLMFYYNMSE